MNYLKTFKTFETCNLQSESKVNSELPKIEIDFPEINNSTSGNHQTVNIDNNVDYNSTMPSTAAILSSSI